MGQALSENYPEEHGKINSREFAEISQMVHRHFGIVLGQEKRGLVISRLHSTLTRRGCAGFSDYIALLKNDHSGEMLSELVNHISTNFTSFYREADHFSYLADIALPDVMSGLRKQKSRDLRIWCAACSSGEEAYTMQITVMRKLGLEYQNFNAGLLATDISAKVLDIAKSGIYSEEQIATVPTDVKQAYFKKNAEGRYGVKESVKQQILFRRLNLMNRQFPFGHQFQIIFCRNVMIYFDEDTRRALIRRFHDYLEPGGYLFIGHSESISPDVVNLKSVASAVYRKSTGGRT